MNKTKTTLGLAEILNATSSVDQLKLKYQSSLSFLPSEKDRTWLHNVYQTKLTHLLFQQPGEKEEGEKREKGEKGRSSQPFPSPLMNGSSRLERSVSPTTTNNTTSYEDASSSSSLLTVTASITLEQSLHGELLPLLVEKTIIQGRKVMRTFSERVYIDIPMGIDQDEMIYIPKQGNIVNGQPQDLCVRITIQFPPTVTRNGLTLTLTVPISLKEALCGVERTLSLSSASNSPWHAIFYSSSSSASSASSDSLKQPIIRPGDLVHLEGKGVARPLASIGEVRRGALLLQFDIQFPALLPQEVILQLKSISF